MKNVSAWEDALASSGWRNQDFHSLGGGSSRLDVEGSRDREESTIFQEAMKLVLGRE